METIENKCQADSLKLQFRDETREEELRSANLPCRQVVGGSVAQRRKRRRHRAEHERTNTEAEDVSVLTDKVVSLEDVKSAAATA
ncbi:hypothetical protein INR49_007322 [Caranx melampygus]|nr:hypothetical protein INR49_007521 [Caranx melampygus]KAG7233243.1 hypothetical protein INR49_007322 [Caranx melampygus]